MKKLKYAATIIALLIPVLLFGSFQKELDSIVPKKGESFDFANAIIALSRLSDRKMNTAWVERRLNLMAAELKKRLAGVNNPGEKIKIINNYLYRDLRFTYDPVANEAFMKRSYYSSYYDPTNYESLERVLRTGKGICNSFTMIYIILGEKLGMPIYGVYMPRHIFVRYQDKDGYINIETTAGGISIPDKEYINDFGLSGRDSGLYGKKRSLARGLCQRGEDR